MIPASDVPPRLARLNAEISANKQVVNRKKGRQGRPDSTNVVSDDGKIMTITTKGVGEDGRAINNVRYRVYGKR